MRKYRILDTLREMAAFSEAKGATAQDVAEAAGILRHNASSDLNELAREGLIRKSGGRPVRFWLADGTVNTVNNGLPAGIGRAQAFLL
ncbi:helix-turn-helix domain-containing protein [Paenibacillus hamazuiensis]|uniref:helix-turn-helix domain-containing protein n=1 Tax=Paenibacillus hamazuiensis TaxID=2936508 RepID=UPI0020108CCF|nr:helix-turn-helix domain-containing protein [Paenibacillus hamazuiensis]